MPHTFPQGTYCSSPLHTGGNAEARARAEATEVASRQVRPVLKARVRAKLPPSNIGQQTVSTRTRRRVVGLGSHSQTGYKGESTLY
jgi:hypothetical protein